ncbi:hypothetical protein FRC04_001593 [Tulasnella sp. 424]|nr:hypothetical protein FRC04_001593 [Tulasnella sp. 424]KAG8971359.1 hypothetical protein FRC05_011121 [Tulasnella sp. 425]
MSVAPVFTAIGVSALPTPERDPNALRPAHHANDTKSLFVNPWPSFRTQTFSSMAKASFIYGNLSNPPAVPDDFANKLGLRKPDFGYTVTTSSGSSTQPDASKSTMKATWLGHACVLLELPSPDGAARGARILFDPVFSHRCGPYSCLGPARYIQPPCKLEELPSVDIVVISHNHYDHLDTHSITTLDKVFRPHFFAPLNNGAYFKANKVAEERTHILDWWEARNVTVYLPGAATSSEEAPVSTVKTTFEVTCTPAQHFTGRGLTDRFHTLWSSWAIRDPASGKKAWFGGDTGYRTVHVGEKEDDVPVCPEFKKIGEKFGGFDLAFIPIGAYETRDAMSSVHCAPQDSVRVFQDIRAKRAIGMHCTWALTNEPLMEPPQKLREECEKLGVPKDAFDVCALGETVFA